MGIGVGTTLTIIAWLLYCNSTTNNNTTQKKSMYGNCGDALTGNSEVDGSSVNEATVTAACIDIQRAAPEEPCM